MLKFFRSAVVYVGYALFIVVPAGLLPLPGWISFLLRVGLFLSLFYFPPLLPVALPILWLVSIPFAVRLPFEAELIVYLIVAVLYFVVLFLPMLQAIFRRIRS